MHSSRSIGHEAGAGRTRRLLWRLALAAAGTLALWGCGGGSASGTESSGATASEAHALAGDGGMKHAAARVVVQEVAGTFRNPLLEGGADPHMTWYQGNYYLLVTRVGSIGIRKFSSLRDAPGAPEQDVWRDGNPDRCCNIWAPELHLLNGPNGQRWYIYYTAGRAADLGIQRSYVLESSGTDPMGPYNFKGFLANGIDGSVYQKANGELYFFWSAFENGQSIRASRMSDPWTLTGASNIVSQPNFDWEKSGAAVNEGPVVLAHGGKLFMTFSASGCWTSDYKLGMLTANEGSDLSQPGAWSKSSNPVFQRNDAAGVLAPGHNGFFKSPDGTEDWLVYHAQKPGQVGCDGTRSTRAQKINWRADGTPDFGVPLSLDTDIALPSISGNPPPPPPPAGDPLPLDQYRSFEVTTPGFTDHFIRHQNSLARTDTVDGASAALLKADATFKVVRGLADGNCYSFEARNYAGSFFRHRDFRLRIDANDGSDLFKNDATFCTRAGLSGTGVTLESKNIPGAYVRHINAEVWLARRGGPNPWDTNPASFDQDSSWTVASPWAP